jgi:ferredoxin-NADP reductase
MTEPADAPTGGARWQAASVVEIRQLTPRIKSFFVKPATPFAFVAGQHVDLKLTAENGYSAVRSYSIASAPETKADVIEIAIEQLGDGEVSPFFHEVVEAGDEIELRAPLGGHFIWRHTDGGPLLLIGAGSGVVPLMSMIRHRSAARADVPTALLLSSRTWGDVPFRDELLQLHRAQTGFSLALALTRDSVRGASDYGRRVDNAMVADVIGRLPHPPKHVFVCGSNGFVNVAADAALAAQIPAATIRTERYGT